MRGWLGRVVLVAARAMDQEIMQSDLHAEPAPVSDPARTVVVHIDSPAPVDLQRETRERDTPFDVVCTSPCDEALPAGSRYRISGDSVRPSRSFVLSEGAARQTFVVAPASRPAFEIGVLLIPLGGLTAGVGSWIVLASSLGDDPGSGASNGHTIGLGLMVGGLAVAAGGIVLAVMNAHSSVRQASDSTGRLVTPAAWSRGAWRDGARDEPPATPMVWLPVVRATF